MLTQQKKPLEIAEAKVKARKKAYINKKRPLDRIKARKTLPLKKKVVEPPPIALTPKEKLIQEERMRDVVLLLKQLVEREEITLKLVIDCLYDVGLINLLNQKIRNKTLNRVLKAIAVMPKPLFRLVALRWLKKNLPNLLATWLEGKVSFK